MGQQRHSLSDRAVSPRDVLDSKIKTPTDLVISDCFQRLLLRSRDDLAGRNNTCCTLNLTTPTVSAGRSMDRALTKVKKSEGQPAQLIARERESVLSLPCSVPNVYRALDVSESAASRENSIADVARGLFGALVGIF